MKFAAIADVHGNIWRSKRCWMTFARRVFPSIVNLGDAASGPLDAARTIDLLIACGAVSIRGNHDRYLIDRAPDKMGSWDRPAYEQLEARHFDWLRALPPTRLFRDSVFLCHGTPASDENYWLEAVLPDGHVQLASAEAIAQAAEGIAHRLILCGHTHLARAVRLADGRMIVNPGSVGSPAYRDVHPYPHVIEAGTPDACYAILEFKADQWQVAVQAGALRSSRDGGTGAGRNSRRTGRARWRRAGCRQPPDLDAAQPNSAHTPLTSNVAYTSILRKWVDTRGLCDKERIMRKAIIIGVGPDRGLGAQLCQRFAAEGLKVYVPAARKPRWRRS